MQLFTLEIRSVEGELLVLRARAAEHIQYMLANKILPSEGFAAGNYRIIIRPYNEATDKEDIGGLTFLGKKAELAVKAGEKVWYVDFKTGEMESGKISSIYYKNETLDYFSVDFDCGDFDEFKGEVMGKCIFTSDVAARAALETAANQP